MLREPSLRPTISAPFLTAAACALSCAATLCQDATDYEAARARYEQVMPRKVFRYHVEGREKLAETGRPEALEQLAQDYAKPQSYPEHTRYTIAKLIGLHFPGEQFVARLAEMRDKHDDEVDTWLWYQTLMLEIEATDSKRTIEIAQTARDAHQRAAAILAVGAKAGDELQSVILPNCVEFPRKKEDRMLLLGAMTGALFDNKRRVNDDGYREGLRAYIGLLADDVKLEPLAKLQMARHLQTILNGPAKFVNPEPWLTMLDRGEVKKPKDYGTSAQSRFFGIETEGERFVYVLDMSDSMLKEIEPSARPKGPITGPKRVSKKKSMALDESDLPWHQIRTRWDLAREHLRISLSRLPDDKQFCIVWFGTEAGTLDATPGLVKASSGNIKKVMAELESIEAAPNEQGKMALRGETSLHYGLDLAFGLGRRGVEDEPRYVGKKPLVEGCDTVFLLSDGAPNWDGFDIRDKNYGEGETYRDVEAGIRSEATPFLNYSGPYANVPTVNFQGTPRYDQVDCWLLRDVRRMNAFRRIRLHCVGLGEANEMLLECLAGIGNGEVFIVGKPKKK